MFGCQGIIFRSPFSVPFNARQKTSSSNAPVTRQPWLRNLSCQMSLNSVQVLWSTSSLTMKCLIQNSTSESRHAINIELQEFTVKRFLKENESTSTVTKTCFLRTKGVFGATNIQIYFNLYVVRFNDCKNERNIYWNKTKNKANT